MAGNYTNYTTKTFRAGVNRNLGEKVEAFLRTEVEVINIKFYTTQTEKVCIVRYVPRDEIVEKYKTNGQDISLIKWGTYYHMKEISVPSTKDISEKVNEFISGEDVEVMDIMYDNLFNQDVALIFYASRAEVDAINEEIQRKHKEEIEKRAQELAEQAVKEPEIQKETEAVLDKYADVDVEKEEEIPETKSEEIEGQMKIEDLIPEEKVEEKIPEVKISTKNSKKNKRSK